MKIGEIANAAGVTTSRIRFYEKRGVIPPAERDDNGYRDYPRELVGRLKFIEYAQNLGFTLREVAAVEPLEDGRPVSCEEAMELLTTKLASVDALVEEVLQRRNQIKEILDLLKKQQRSDYQPSQNDLTLELAQRFGVDTSKI